MKSADTGTPRPLMSGRNLELIRSLRYSGREGEELEEGEEREGVSEKRKGRERKREGGRG